MRDKQRIDKILDLVRELWEKYPDQRLGQIMYNYVFDNRMVDMFYVEDEDVINSISKYL